MIKVAIAPILSNMDLANEGDYFFILANYYQKYPEYRKFFLDHKGEKFTVVDNGAYEFGKPLPMKELLEIYNEAGCNELILPDVEYDWDQTRKLSLEAIAELDSIYNYSSDQRKEAPNLQWVLQGKSYGDMISNCENFVHEREFKKFSTYKIRTFGIPLYKKDWRGRIDVVKELGLGTVNRFHLLGLHDPIELAFYQEKHKVERCDGGFAAKFGAYDMKWSKSAEFPNDRKKYPNDIVKLKDRRKDIKSAIFHNIQTALFFANRGNRIMRPGNQEFLDTYRDRDWM